MIGIATKFAPEPAAFATAQQAGFRRAELWTDDTVLSRWEEVAGLAREHPFDWAIHFPNRLEQSSQTLERAVALYRALDCTALVIHQPHLDRHGAVLKRLDSQLRLAVENHKLTPEAFQRWAEESPGLALDVEHLWKFTLRDAPLEEVLAFVRRFLDRHASRLLHVHMPGYLPGWAEHRPMYCSRDLVLGVLSLLAEVEFSGLIVSEVNLEFQNLHDLRMDVLLFERWRELYSTSSLPPPGA